MSSAAKAGRNPGGPWGLLVVGAASVVLAGFAGVLWYAYSRGTTAESSAPLLVADKTPIKSKPTSQPIVAAPSPDLELWELLRKNQAPQPLVERVQPAPEAPLPRPAPEPAQHAARPAAPLPEAVDRPASDIGGLLEKLLRDPPAAGPAPAPPSPPQVAARPPAPSPRPGAYRVQLASLQSEEGARAVLAQARKDFGDLLRGIDAAVVPGTLSDKRIVWRVQVGPLASRDAAGALCDTLRARKQTCLVIAP